MGLLLLRSGSLAALLLFTAAGFGRLAALPSSGRRRLGAAGLALLFWTPGLLALVALGDTAGRGLWTWNAVLWGATLLLARRAFFMPSPAPWPVRRLAVAGGVFTLLTASTFWALDEGVRGRLEALRTEAAALAAGAPRIPDRENAAPLYQEAFESLRSLENASTLPKERLEAWLEADAPPADLKSPEAGALLSSASGHLSLLRHAASRPGSRFERNSTSFVSTLLPELGEFRHAARWLTFEARAAAAHGDLASAFRNAAALSHMAEHASGEPFLISLLVGVSLEMMARDLVDEILAASSPSREALAPLEQGPPLSYRIHLQRALKAELAGGLGVFSSLAGSSDPSGVALLLPFWRVFLMDEDLEGYRAELQGQIDRLSMTYPEARKQVEEERPKPPARGRFGGMLAPALDRMLDQAPRGDAFRRLIRVSAALAAFREAKGRHAERLEELSPAYLARLPLDPFDLRPLRLARKGTGVVVYSVGPDGKDDGGDVGKEGKDLGIRIGTGS